MAVAADTANTVAWWKEPTKDQWLAWVAAWLGWTLDAFDFTIFLLIMVPIAKEFQGPLVDVTFVFTVTLWLRLVGATASGWLADRAGRKLPLMISILWYSICNFIAGFSPSFWFLFLFRALLGIGMGAEWPAGAALAMESWPTRSRGFMSGVLQGAWGLGFALSSAAYDPAGEPDAVCLELHLGRGRRQDRPALGDDHPGGDRHRRDAVLSRLLHHELCRAGWGLYRAGLFRRRGVRPEPELSERALPDRGARDGGRLLLSPGRDLGWPRRAVAGGLGRDNARRLHDADADHHGRERDRVHHRIAARAGDKW